VAADAVGIPFAAAGARFGRAAALALCRDGGRLPAGRRCLPAARRAGRVPAILIFTPYYRRFALRAFALPESETSPGVARGRDLFVPRGYALVAVDVRGTGASFGTRDSFRSPRERDDYARIAEWVTPQPWSDGRIGATGAACGRC
jgi:hypothetical protein